MKSIFNIFKSKDSKDDKNKSGKAASMDNRRVRFDKKTSSSSSHKKKQQQPTFRDDTLLGKTAGYDTSFIPTFRKKLQSCPGEWIPTPSTPESSPLSARFSPPSAALFKTKTNNEKFSLPRRTSMESETESKYRLKYHNYKNYCFDLMEQIDMLKERLAASEIQSRENFNPNESEEIKALRAENAELRERFYALTVNIASTLNGPRNSHHHYPTPAHNFIPQYGHHGQHYQISPSLRYYPHRNPSFTNQPLTPPNEFAFPRTTSTVTGYDQSETDGTNTSVSFRKNSFGNSIPSVMVIPKPQPQTSTPVKSDEDKLI